MISYDIFDFYFYFFCSKFGIVNFKFKSLVKRYTLKTSSIVIFVSYYKFFERWSSLLFLVKIFNSVKILETINESWEIFELFWSKRSYWSPEFDIKLITSIIKKALRLAWKDFSPLCQNENLKEEPSLVRYFFVYIYTSIIDIMFQVAQAKIFYSPTSYFE